MMVRETVCAVEGGLYRLTSPGGDTMPIPALGHVYRLRVDFEEKTVEYLPPRVGDRVVAWFEGGGYSSGFIIGFEEGAG